MERTKGMIVGFGFIFLTLFIKGLYTGPHANFLALSMAFSISLGPTLIANRGKIRNEKNLN